MALRSSAVVTVTIIVVSLCVLFIVVYGCYHTIKARRERRRSGPSTVYSESGTTRTKSLYEYPIINPQTRSTNPPQRPGGTYQYQSAPYRSIEGSYRSSGAPYQGSIGSYGSGPYQSYPSAPYQTSSGPYQSCPGGNPYQSHASNPPQPPYGWRIPPPGIHPTHAAIDGTYGWNV